VVSDRSIKCPELFNSPKVSQASLINYKKRKAQTKMLNRGIKEKLKLYACN